MATNLAEAVRVLGEDIEALERERDWLRDVVDKYEKKYGSPWKNGFTDKPPAKRRAKAKEGK